MSTAAGRTRIPEKTNIENSVVPGRRVPGCGSRSTHPEFCNSALPRLSPCKECKGDAVGVSLGESLTCLLCGSLARREQLLDRFHQMLGFHRLDHANLESLGQRAFPILRASEARQGHPQPVVLRDELADSADKL